VSYFTHTCDSHLADGNQMNELNGFQCPKGKGPSGQMTAASKFPNKSMAWPALLGMDLSCGKEEIAVTMRASSQIISKLW